jgi:hypothetical protein
LRSGSSRWRKETGSVASAPGSEPASASASASAGPRSLFVVAPAEGAVPAGGSVLLSVTLSAHAPGRFAADFECGLFYVPPSPSADGRGSALRTRTLRSQGPR